MGCCTDNQEDHMPPGFKDETKDVEKEKRRVSYEK
jgi:hypothetical protein